jgi:hypothetical protein
MKKYNELIQFEPVTTTIELEDSADHNKAEKLISSYVISDKMKSKLNDTIIKHLQYDEFTDQKALWIVGNYGSGKSHLMSVISALAEFPDLAAHVTNDEVRKCADQIAGKFKVIRFEIGASKKDLTDIITDELTDGLKEMGVHYEFPPMDEVTNHKKYIEEMMLAFHEKYSDHGLLLICDEILDYYRSRNQQQLPLDMAILRTIGEVIEGTKFRFIAGVQEAIFSDPKLSFISKEIKRITDRAAQVVIVREDIKFVVAERLLKKSAQQKEWIKDYLQKFTPYYGQMNERLEEFVDMFPVHPDYISTFEKVKIAGLEQRQVLKSLSSSMNRLMEQDVPEDIPGVFSYDTYWYELSAEPSMKTNHEVGQVIATGETLLDRIEQAYPNQGEKEFAKRLVAGLAIHRMAVGDIFNEMGATAAELRDSLCMFLKTIDVLPGEKNKNLENHIVTVLGKIRKTVNGQFFAKNKSNDQFYIDLKRTVDFDAKIETKASTLANDDINFAYRAAMLEILEQSDTQQAHQMWHHELKWIDRNVNRQGWLFLGSPNERETAKPQRDYYMYFIQPEDAPKHKKENIREDEVLFVLKNRDEEFNRLLKYYAASIQLRSNSTGSAKNTYKLKADDYLRDMQKWIRNHIADAFEVKYNGQSKPIMDWLKGTSVRDITGISTNEHANVKDIFEAVASYIFEGYFQSLAPEYPKFSQWITGDTMQGAATDVLNSLSGIGSRTKRATAVMDALELLDGDKLQATKSRFSATVLDVLKSKGHGQVVNNGELLDKVNANFYFKPDTYRLEPEWLLVILASLVYSGELELSVVGNNITASNADLLKSLDFNDLVNFKHIQAPKDFNTSAIKALLELLDMNEGLAISIQQGDDGIVREMGDKIEQKVKSLVTDSQAVKERLLLWGQHVLEDNEAELLTEKLTSAKKFLEEMQRFNTPGKLKNLKATPEDIALQKENLIAWNDYKQLELTVKEFSGITNYLSKAQLVLAENDDWQETVKSAQQELRQGLADKDVRLSTEFKQKTLKQLADKKQSYITHFVTLYQRAHLTRAEDPIKAALINDERLLTLNLLCGIALLPSNQVKDWREDWANLEIAIDIDSKMLAADPNPVSFNPRTTKNLAPASNRLNRLDDQLDAMLTEWTSTLQTNVADPLIQLDLMKSEQQAEVTEFIKSGCLPEPLTKDFVEEVNKVLRGLVAVKISSEELVASLGKGTPQSIDDVRKRFESLVSERCKGKDSDNIRIVIE